MSNKKLNLFGLSASLVFGLTLTACNDDLSEDAHYKTPDFLVGNAIEVLQKDGNYKTFLKGIELTGLTDVVDSQILTVLAPTDEAFAVFLKEKGYKSIEEMYAANPTYTQQLISYHLLYYAMDWEKMTNFRPMEGDAATELEKERNAGMYNRFRTRCVESVEVVKSDDKTLKDSILNVIHYDRYLTVFSEKMFDRLGIDAASNYNYFFPNTQWNPNHLANGFNVMNAAVLDTKEVVTDNGYLYHIDHVIEPVGTVYEELGKNPEYSFIKSLFDQYAYWECDEVESENYGYHVYSKRFRNLPNIASEWPVPKYTQFTDNSFNSWNLFVPTNEALNRMFTEFWDENSSYRSVQDLHPLIQRKLIEMGLGYAKVTESLTTDTSYMCYPDYIRQNKVYSHFKNDITTDPATFDMNLVCNNGVIYGSSKMDLPDVFKSVAGPAFKDARYLPYLAAIETAGMLLSFSSKQSDFVTLIPDTAQFTHHEPAMRLVRDATELTPTYLLQQWDDQEADFKNVNAKYATEMVNMNTTKAVKELKTTGLQVISTDASFNYWYVNDGKITTNSIFNEQLNPSFEGEVWSEFHEIPCTISEVKWSNGRAYSYDYKSIFMPASGTTLETELSLNNDRRYPYYCFVQLLKLAGLVKDGSFVFVGANTIRYIEPDSRFFVFAPTNEAIKESLKTIPGADKLSINESTYVISGTPSSKTKLASYLLNYFVSSDREGAAFDSYPYPGSTCKGNFVTAGNYLLNVADNGSTLSVSFQSKAVEGADVPEGNVVNVVDKYYSLPFVFSDGALQLIDTILK